MAYNGLGVFTPAISFVADQAAGTGPQASRFDTVNNDIASGLSTAICRDGQTTITANIPFANKKITNLGDPTNPQDAVNLRSMQTASGMMYVIGAGSGTAITGSTSPSFGALSVGMMFMVVAPADSGTGCTFAVNGLTARPIIWPGTVVPGNFKANDVLLLLWDGSNFRWLNRWRHSDIPVGAGFVLCDVSAPVGWTQDVNASINDRLIRMVNGGTGTTTGGNWAISGLSIEDNQHTHNVIGNTGNTSTGSVGPFVGGSGSLLTPEHFHSMSFASSVEVGNHHHTGDGTWRPAYINVIRCTRLE